MKDLLDHTSSLYLPITGQYFYYYDIQSICFRGNPTICFDRFHNFPLSFFVRVQESNPFLHWIQNNEDMDGIFEILYLQPKRYSIYLHVPSERTLMMIARYWTVPPVIEFSIRSQAQDLHCPFHLLDLYEMGYMSPIRHARIGVIPVHECFLGVELHTTPRTDDHVSMIYTMDYFMLNIFLENSITTSSSGTIHRDILRLLHTMPFRGERQHAHAIDFWDQTASVNITNEMLDMDRLDVCAILPLIQKILDRFENFKIRPRVTAKIRFHGDSTNGFFPAPHRQKA